MEKRASITAETVKPSKAPPSICSSELAFVIICPALIAQAIEKVIQVTPVIGRNAKATAAWLLGIPNPAPAGRGSPIRVFRQ